jgi:predicted glycosyltransferase
MRCSSLKKPCKIMTLADKNIFYPVESMVGLGHFNRAGAISRALTGQGAHVTVTSGTFVDERRFFAGADTRTLTPHVFKDDDRWIQVLPNAAKREIDPGAAQIAAGQRLHEHLRALENAHPDVMISEFWPFDRSDFDSEMMAVLNHQALSNSHVLKIASLRDILDTPQEGVLIDSFDISGRAQRDTVAADVVNKHFDAVLIHGDPALFKLADTFNAASKIQKDIVYTGYITAELPKRDPNADYTHAPLIVGCGSGKDAQEIVFSFLTSWNRIVHTAKTTPELRALCDRPVHIIAGPRYNDTSYNDTIEWAARLSNDCPHPVTVEGYDANLTKRVAAAAFCVSLAGYNSTLEVLSIGTPSLFVPKFTVHQGKQHLSTEQLYRMRKLEKLGIASFSPADQVLRPDHFASRIIQEFNDQTAQNFQRPQLDFSGVDKTIKYIDKALSLKPAA